jgi:Flp pilus assembly protein TadG
MNRFCPLFSGIALSRRDTSPAGYSRLQAFRDDQSGNIAIAAALAMPVLIGGAGLGVEVGYWYFQKQAMQSAADSAAVAAATAGGSSYDEEARAVAAQYGFIHGQKNISVTASNNSPCPAGGSDCYEVTITSYVPLFLSPLVGYSGSTTVSTIKNGAVVTSRQTELTSAAVATRVSTPRDYCIVALGENGAKWDMLINGGSKSEIKNCGIMSNDTMLCNGQGQIADYADSPQGDSSPCGQEAHNRPAQKIPDPYASLADNIPPDPCYGNYSGTLASSANGYTLWCGEFKLTSNKTYSDTALVIYNGNLNTNGYNFTGSNTNVVFSGTNPGTLTDTKGGSKAVVDIKAPTTGTWSGVAVYQDSRFTTAKSSTIAGNSPTWDITGLVYLPQTALTVSGAVGKSSSGNSCFVLVVDSLTVNGTGQILVNGTDCQAAGLKMPTMQRGKLVG